MKVLILLNFCVCFCVCFARPTNEADNASLQLNTSTNQKVEEQPLESYNKNNIKYSGTEKIEQPESAVSKDYEKDYLFLKDRMPDLTIEEYAEINKEDSTPWGFLKRMNIKKNIKNTNIDPKQILRPIYITVPIVINGHTTLPLSLSIGGQNIPLNIPSEVEAPSFHTNLETSSSRSIEKPTSVINKENKPTRETNRHRSNLRKFALFT